MKKRFLIIWLLLSLNLFSYDMTNENIIKEAKSLGITIVDKDISIGKPVQNKISKEDAIKALSGDLSKMNILEVGNYAYVLLQSANVDISDAISISFKGKTYNYVPLTMDRIANIYFQNQGLVDLSGFYREPIKVSILILRKAAENAGLDEFESSSINDLEVSNNKYIINRTLMAIEVWNIVIKQQVNKWWNLKIDEENLIYNMTYDILTNYYLLSWNLDFINGKWNFVDISSDIEKLKTFSPDLYKLIAKDVNPILIVWKDLTTKKEKDRKAIAEQWIKNTAIESKLKEELAIAEKELATEEQELEKGRIELAKIFAANRDWN